jgi:ABC-type branched-subunit amino acid transport system ATPase component
VFLDDRDRKNTDGTTMLLGEAGSGKTRLLKAVMDKFNGYLW